MKKCNVRLFAALLFAAAATTIAWSQALWSGRLESPDHRYVLYQVPFQEGITNGPQLWLENASSGSKQMLFELSRTITARWTPDSSAFAVNNEYASDGTDAYIYDIPTLSRMNVGEEILAAFPGAKRFAHDHSYFDIQSWQDPKHVLVRFHGHAGSPVECFDSQYVVARDGKVTKVSEVSGPIGRLPCSKL